MGARFQRLFACAAVLVYLAGTGAGLLHQATVQHVRCAEHGQLEDQPSRPPVAAFTPPSAGDLLAAAPQGEAGETHAHCGIPDALERPRTLVTVPNAPPPVTPFVVALDSAGTRVASGSAVWRVAPKQSPPA